MKRIKMDRNDAEVPDNLLLVPLILEDDCLQGVYYSGDELHRSATVITDTCRLFSHNGFEVTKGELISLFKGTENNEEVIVSVKGDGK
jgi:hypothetical protein